jgi:hypothetical protein
MDTRSNCFKVHPQTDAGHCVYCGQDITANRYIHLIQKVSDAPDFCLFVKSNFNISELSCILGQLKIVCLDMMSQLIKSHFLMELSVEDDKTLMFFKPF